MSPLRELQRPFPCWALPTLFVVTYFLFSSLVSTPRVSFYYWGQAVASRKPQNPNVAYLRDVAETTFFFGPLVLPTLAQYGLIAPGLSISISHLCLIRSPRSALRAELQETFAHAVSAILRKVTRFPSGAKLLRKLSRPLHTTAECSGGKAWKEALH